MWNNESLQLTGNPVIDAVKDLQIMANNIENTDYKMMFIKRRLAETQVASLFETTLFIGASSILMKRLSHKNDERIRFTSRLIFTAGLQEITYMYDEKMPIDSLTLVFDCPTIHSVDNDVQDGNVSDLTETIAINTSDITDFGNSRLQVPVLSIDMCESMTSK